MVSFLILGYRNYVYRVRFTALKPTGRLKSAIIRRLIVSRLQKPSNECSNRNYLTSVVGAAQTPESLMME
jgi:hypothetical protein